MDRFDEEIYGKVLWECYRSKVYIVMLSLMYVLLGAAAVIWAMNEDQFLFYILAVVVIFFCLWRINRVHHPVALICERKLLVAVPWSFFTFDYYITFRALYMPVAYKDVAGVSSRWNHLYIGGREGKMGKNDRGLSSQFQRAPCSFSSGGYPPQTFCQ